MSIRKTFYGEDNPSSLRQHSIHALFIMLALALWGMHSDFIPSQSWSKTGWYISLVIGILVTTFTWWIYWSGMAQLKRKASRFKKVMIYISLPFFIVILIWAALVHGASSLINHTFGDEEEVIVSLEKVNNYRRRSCTYRLEGKYLNNAIPSHICISKASFERPPKTVHMVLRGYKTQLGFLIDEHYEHER